MELAAFQEQIETTYGDRDRARGIPSTVAWLAEEVGELAKAVRKGSRAEQVHELSDVLAWLVSLASQLSIPIDEAAARYANGCPRCGGSPCACGSTPEELGAEPDAALLRRVVEYLGTSTNAGDPTEFPPDEAVGASAGLYAWWVDESGTQSLQAAFDDRIKPLVYVGQAGASSKATLRSRVRGNHVRGNIYGSTLRRTFAAILFDQLGLKLADRRRLTSDSETQLSEWIASHLSVAAIAIPERSQIQGLEPLVVRRLDPAFNLDHVGPSPNRTRLRELRRRLESPAL